MKKLFAILSVLLVLALTLAACDPLERLAEKLFPDRYAVAEKPVIYLYPEEPVEAVVKLDYAGTLTTTYPKYEDGWSVLAEPDGTLTDSNGQTYSYLYWEGVDETAYDSSRGFCVKGEDAAAFLEDALAQLGLTRREANEFIVYWLPKLEANAYNVIAFQADAYTDAAKLEISPAPDTLIRVFMAFYGASEPVELEPQTPDAPAREGLAAVEWGGAEVVR